VQVHTQRFIRYGVVGALATATHYVMLVLCVESAGWPAWLGSGLGAAIGAQVAYLGNRRYTFAHRGAIGESWLKFQGTALLGALLGMAIVAAGVHVGLHYLLAQVVATAAMLVLTFAINRAWSFR
jgi:putative flippase GtrA